MLSLFNPLICQAVIAITMNNIIAIANSAQPIQKTTPHKSALLNCALETLTTIPKPPIPASKKPIKNDAVAVTAQIRRRDFNVFNLFALFCISYLSYPGDGDYRFLLLSPRTLHPSWVIFIIGPAG
jgi:hypothetical protein